MYLTLNRTAICKCEIHYLNSKLNLLFKFLIFFNWDGCFFFVQECSLWTYQKAIWRRIRSHRLKPPEPVECHPDPWGVRTLAGTFRFYWIWSIQIVSSIALGGTFWLSRHSFQKPENEKFSLITFCQNWIVWNRNVCDLHQKVIASITIPIRIVLQFICSNERSKQSTRKMCVLWLSTIFLKEKNQKSICWKLEKFRE